MRGTLLAARCAPLALALLCLGAPDRAAAIQVPVPGERTLEIHGFYEARLLFTGEDIGGNSGTFSSFRHVFTLETEIEMFPDGVGPFDFIFLFTRWQASYECIYERACGTWGSADSFGGDRRTPNRLPKNLKTAHAQSIYVGGLDTFKLRFDPGTLRPVEAELNPGERYRNCINPSGVGKNPYPFALLCNFFARSTLDGPIDPFLGASGDTRAGAFNPVGRFNLIGLGRALLPGGETEFRRLRNLSIQPNSANTRLSSGKSGIFRALNRGTVTAGVDGRPVIGPASGASQFQSVFGLDPNTDADAALYDGLFFTGSFQGTRLDENGVPVVLDCDKPSANCRKVDASAVYTNSFDAGFGIASAGTVPDLLQVRPDVNRYERLALGRAPELLSAQWGSNSFSRVNVPFTPTIDQPYQSAVDPYFGGGALDIFNHFEEGVAGKIEDRDIQRSTLPRGYPLDDAPLDQLGEGAIPFLVGPDGIQATRDDLPFVTPGVELDPIKLTAQPSIFSQAIYVATAKVRSTTIDSNRNLLNPLIDDLSTGAVVELYGVKDPVVILSSGCGALGGAVDGAGRCIVGAVDETARAFEDGCNDSANLIDRNYTGVNRDGDCIRLNAGDRIGGLASVPFGILSELGNLDYRPSEAVSEPLDLTDAVFRSQSKGKTLPARPPSVSGGLSYPSPGLQDLVRTSSHLISNLDLDYSEDELRWNHGASQDTHEFVEGYVEFEMFDSQLFARVGKILVVWGKTELFRNQDRWNPVDIGNGLFQPLEEARISQWGTSITISPEAWMRVGPVQDLRVELVAYAGGSGLGFQPTDLGKCGEGSALALICLKAIGVQADGLLGLGVVGERRPRDDYKGLARYDYGIRIEGRLDRFTFAISDYYGWNDGFYLDLVNQYSRPVDFTTGAPVRAGGSSCTLRRNQFGAPVGPDGIPGTPDDDVSSSGGCLLFDTDETVDPNNPARLLPIGLRDSDAIALTHTVNQSFFHTLCTLSFNPDQGRCVFDQINTPGFFQPVSGLFAGDLNIGELAVQGIDTIRGVNDRLQPVVDTGLLFQTIAKGGPVEGKLVVMQNEQKALLGCGPAYATPCDGDEQLLFTNNGTETFIGRDSFEVIGGIDFMNADASVLTQDFSVLKVASSNALVGTRNGPSGALVWLPGISYTRFGDNGRKDTAAAAREGYLTSSSYSGIGQLVAADPNTFGVLKGGLTASEAIALGPAGRNHLSNALAEFYVTSDGWIEPAPWEIDPIAFDRFGALVFQVDPADPEGNDPNSGTVRNRNPDGEPVGEYCGTLFGDFLGGVDTFSLNNGCTDLEIVSANIERFFISNEILGGDDVFDPPETLAELQAILSSSFAAESFGDPIAGPDGIFPRNVAAFNPTVADVMVGSKNAPAGTGLGFGTVDSRPFVQAFGDITSFNEIYDPETCNDEICLLEVFGDPLDPLDPNKNTVFSRGVTGAEVGLRTSAQDPRRHFVMMPVSARVFVYDAAGNVLFDDGTNFIPLPDKRFEFSPSIHEAIQINLAKLDTDISGQGALLLGKLFTTDFVQIPPDMRPCPECTQMRLQPDPQTGSNLGTIGKILGSRSKNNAGFLDFTEDATNDIDQDQDGVYDGLDDFQPGPTTDDAILCGSGIPGDVLQDGLQFQPAFLDETPDSAAFLAAFPEGLPPRSPVFCQSIVGLLGATGQTLPFAKAGGDGTFGRRDFLWHSGREISFRYDKLNVFGFGLDFAEDVTKTSWGIEFTWTSGKTFNTTRTFDGLNTSDEFVLSVSVDRPTFFNFLNPNRSFFLNFQVFFRYLSDFDGSRDNRDGMYGSAEGPWSSFMTFFVMTGYFQDRLNPRLILVYDPTTSNGAAIVRVGYRWNDAFSSEIGYRSFFGHPARVERQYFPIVAITSPEQRFVEAFGRGIAPVRNRDSITFKLRYSF